MVRTPRPIVFSPCIAFFLRVRPQDDDLTISIDRRNRCEYPIGDHHVGSEVNVRINAPYVTLEQFRIVVVLTCRLQGILHWSDESRIFSCIVVFIFHEFNDRSN
jgi:hypothetical protein